MPELFPSPTLKAHHDLSIGDFIAYGDNRRALVLSYGKGQMNSLLDLDSFRLCGAETALAGGAALVLATQYRIEFDPQIATITSNETTLVGGEVGLVLGEDELIFVLTRSPGDRQEHAIGLTLRGKRFDIGDYGQSFFFFDRWALTTADSQARRTLYTRLPPSKTA